jgi:hypothetical protein
LLLGGFALIGVAIIAIVFYGSASATPFTCDSLLTPGPTDVLPTPTASPRFTSSPSPSPTAAPTPSPSPTPDPSASPTAIGSPTPSPSPSPSITPVPSPTLRLGFPTKDLGRTHVPNNSTVEYGFCPPTSGNHYIIPGQAPLPRAFYGPERTDLKPQNWVHNLEHGYVVLLYKGTPDQATIDSIKQVMDTAAGDALSTGQCAMPNRVIAVRFDDMGTAFAALAWDRAMLMPTWDPVAAKTFAEQWQESPAIPEPGTC